MLDPYFSGTKIEWLLREGGVEADADLAVGTIDTWLLWNLTGGAVHATEPSNASRTMLYDIATSVVRRAVRAARRARRGAARGAPVQRAFGVTAPPTGLPAGVPISGIAGDQQAALFGQACFEPGMTKNTYGTGSFVLMNVGRRAPSRSRGC